MDKQIKKILKNPVKLLSEATEIDIYSKKICLLEQSLMLIDSIIKNKDLTDTALNYNVSKSQLSKLDLQRGHIRYLLNCFICCSIHTLWVIIFNSIHIFV